MAKETSIKEVVLALVGVAVFLTFALSLLTYVSMFLYFLIFGSKPSYLDEVVTTLGWSFIAMVFFFLIESGRN